MEISENDVFWDDPGEAQSFGDYDIVHDPKIAIPNARFIRLRATHQISKLFCSGFWIVDETKANSLSDAEQFLKREIMERLQLIIETKRL